MTAVVPLAVTEKLAVDPTTALCAEGWPVMASVAAPVAVKLWRSMLYSNEPSWPACAAWSVMRPGAVGVTVKTPPTGPVIEAAPVEPGTTVSVMGSVELAVGATVKEPALITRSCWAAKLTDCHWAFTAPVV